MSREPDDETGRRRYVLFGLLGVGFLIVLVGAGAAAGIVPFDLDSDDDNDGLPDRRERALGTDPEDRDTDDDRLLDSWEAKDEDPDGQPLPESDPLHKDLYVQVNYGKGVPKMTDAERAQLEREWANMPVANPDGSQGVRLHLVEDRPPGGRLDTRVVVTGDRSREELVQRFYTTELLGERRCVFHQVVLGVIDNGTTVGYGDTPGYLSVVDGTGVLTRGGNVTVRNRYIMHELLHNVVGRLEADSYHTSEGWLSHRAFNVGRNEYLSEAAASALNDSGFARSRYYSRNCD